MFANTFGHHVKVECGLIYNMKKKPKPGGYHFDQEITVPVPLQSVTVQANVLHAVAQVELTQVFVNKENQPIEATYFFPVDPNGGVTHFHTEIDGRTITGIVKPQEEAKAQYDKAVAQKQTAFLVDSNKPDIFKVRIGFLKPGAQVKVVIGYVTEVKNEKGSNAQRFFIPTTVAPRYIPEEDTDKKSVDLKNMKFSETTPAPMSITVNIALQGGIKSIDSPTHEVRVTEMVPVPGKPNWTSTVVTLSGNTTEMDRDFVLLIIPDEVHAPRLYVEEFEKSTAVMTHLIPSFKLDDQKVELIFILDRSGSMTGKSIELAKKALLLFLHSAPVGCYFNIVGFGSTFKLLFPNSVKYEDESLKKAIAYAKSLQADLGGTELLQPLKTVFDMKLIPGYLRQIFVLTDGEISNTDAVLGLTKSNSHLGRLFSLGIGDSSSHHLVEGLAEAGGGTCSFTTYSESIDSKVLQQLKNAIQPSLSDVTAEWIGVKGLDQVQPKVSNKNTTVRALRNGKGSEKPVETSQDVSTKKVCNQVPEKIPPIYEGSQLLVFGLFENSLPTGVNIKAKSPDGPLSVQIQFDQKSNFESYGMLHKLAAIKLVRELETKIVSFNLGYSANKDTPRVEALKKEIISISCQHGISSKYTSFVAVDTDDKTTDENWVMQTRHVPSQYAHGWNGGYGYSSGFDHSASPGSCASFKMMAGSSGKNRRRLGRADSSAQKGCSEPKCGRSGSNRRVSAAPSRKCGSATGDSSSYEDEPMEVAVGSSGDTPKKITTPEDRLYALVGTQSFNGSFPLNDAFARSMGQKLEDLKKEAKKLGLDEAAFATAFALAYFTKKLNGLKDSWELVEVKAKKWLVNNFPDAHADILTTVAHFVKA